jgi:hypothetical protein
MCSIWFRVVDAWFHLLTIPTRVVGVTPFLVNGHPPHRFTLSVKLVGADHVDFQLGCFQTHPTRTHSMTRHDNPELLNRVRQAQPYECTNA